MRKVFPAAVLVCLSVFCLSQTPDPAGAIKDKYHAIEVGTFEIQKGVELPPDYFASLQDELVKQLQESHRFQAVLRPGEQPAQAEMPVLRLTGVVTKFNQGNRAKRYFGSFGAGSSQLFADARYTDRNTGETVIEEEVIGTLSGGVFGGDSKNVIREFATAVVTTTKLILLKKAGQGTVAGAVNSPAAADAAPAEQSNLEIKAGELDAKQKSLDELAAKGFRITKYTSTSNKTATITLEKAGDPSAARQYLMLQTLMPGTLQKELNRAAADGYRLVPHTLGYLKGYFLIAEKPAAAMGSKYEYRFHVTIRVSAAENNVKQDQAQGFVLVDTSQVQNQLHLIVLEKEIKD